MIVLSGNRQNPLENELYATSWMTGLNTPDEEKDSTMKKMKNGGNEFLGRTAN